MENRHKNMCLRSYLIFIPLIENTLKVYYLKLQKYEKIPSEFLINFSKFLTFVKIFSNLIINLYQNVPTFLKVFSITL